MDRRRGMNRRQLLGSGAALLAGSASLGLPGHAATLEASQIQETVFPNGLRLVTKVNHATGLAAIQVWIRAGGFTENEKTAGTAHVIEHLLFKASERSTAIDAEVENLGGLLEARTEKDWTQIQCTVSGRHAGKVISLLGSTFSKPIFREEDLASERPILIEELNQSVLNPTEIVTRELFRLAFKQHPYRFEVRGTGAFISGIGIEAVRAYYQKHFVPSAMTVVVVGDVDPAGVERVVRAAFPVDGKPATLTPIPPVEQPIVAPQRATIPGLTPVGIVALGYPAVAVSEQPGVHATDLLLTMLENGDGGRLPKLFRGAAGLNANFQTRRQAGLLTVIAQTLPDRVDQVETLLRRELEFVANGRIPVEELDLAKRALRGSYALDSETYGGQASTLGFYAAIDKWQFATEYLQKIEAVTIEQVRAVAAKSLVADRCIAVQMLPRERGPRRPQQDGT